MHTITTRHPTPDEQKKIASQTNVDFSSYGCATSLAAGSAWTFGKLGHWLGAFHSDQGAQYGQWVGWSVVAASYITLIISFIQFERKQRRLAKVDHENQLVQEIHVSDPRVVEIATVWNEGPNLALDIGDGTILYLQGQWLYNCDIYGAESPSNDDGDEMFNGLPAPHSFPCSEFTISRLPNSGEVLRISVVGSYLLPESAIQALKPEHRFQPSELFKGSIEDISGILDREHRTRTAK